MILCQHCKAFPVTGNQKSYCSELCYREAKKIRERLRKTPPKPEAQTRKCMRCDRLFHSEHKYHRLCNDCRRFSERLVSINGEIA